MTSVTDLILPVRSTLNWAPRSSGLQPKVTHQRKPVRSRRFLKSSGYMYSSAVNYVTDEGIIAIELMFVPKTDARKFDWTREVENW